MINIGYDYLYNVLHEKVINGEMSVNTLKLFRLTCPECLHLLKSNDSVTEIVCTNDICQGRLAAKMETALKSLGVKNFGMATCMQIINQNNLSSHMEIFNLPAYKYPYYSSEDVRNRMWQSVEDVKNLTLGEVIKLFNFSDFSSRALDLFEEYDDIDKFYNDFHHTFDDPETFVSSKIKVDYGKTTELITNHLIFNEYQIKEVVKYFRIKPVSNLKYNIMMTGDITSTKREDGSSYKPREQFYKYISDKSAGYVTISMKSSVTEDTDFLLTDKEVSTIRSQNSRKMNTALDLGVKIVSFKEFENLINSIIDRKNEEGK